MDLAMRNWLEENGACVYGQRWVREGGFTSLADAFDACNQPDWLRWALDKTVGITDHEVREWALWCVEQVAEYIPVGEPRDAYDAARLYQEGKIDWDGLRLAHVAARFALSRLDTRSVSIAAWRAARAAYHVSGNSRWEFEHAAALATDAGVPGRLAAERAQCDKLRQMMGNPFRGRYADAGVQKEQDDDDLDA